jgi:hypothetical protein
MGFMRLTPRNAIATRVAGARTFVYGGAIVFLMGAAGAALALAGVVALAWEQAALMVLGAAVVTIGLVIPRSRLGRF